MVSVSELQSRVQAGVVSMTNDQYSDSTDLRLRFAESGGEHQLGFVEAETPNGQSVEIGKWTKDEDHHCLDLSLDDLIGLITDEPETAYIVKEEANESYKVFLDVENAREENNRGHWKARALYSADFPRVTDDGK